MTALESYKQLVDLVLLIPELVKLNAEGRQKIRDAVGTVADELIRGLNLVESRIAGAIVLARSSDKNASEQLQLYVAESGEKLSDAFAEFKICRGLREVRDEFVRPFALLKETVRLENVNRIDKLLHELSKDERMIVDEVGPLLAELREASQDGSTFVQLARRKMEVVGDRRTDVRGLARRVIDDL